ncbi:MAG TPA: type II toxin-antitoxin system HicB family antitoxin [Gaiellaceae bacterium]|nr:type II toxin-antitoxin system HicB family antitoxin [Gaiellaceae bacterium]
MSYRSRQRLRQKDRERHTTSDDERPKVQDYLNLPYHVTLVRDEEGKGGWLAAVEELPGCAARGRTPQEAVTKISSALSDWISTAIQEGREIPQPKSAESHSGRLLLRMPRTLHAELTRVAEREGVSLNQFITDVLAAAVGWRAPAGTTSTHADLGQAGTDKLEQVSVQALDTAPLALEPEEPEAPRRRVNLIAAALAANVVVIAMAGVVALLVLLAAWR